MIYTIETELQTAKYNNKRVIFRIHESGDFYNMEYTEKWIAIVKHFENNPQIIFLAYTKSITYFINCGYGLECFPHNLVIRSSIWDDTADDKKGLTNIYNIPIYTALSKEDMQTEKKNGRKFYKCECIDCSNCRMCWNGTLSEIICEIH